MPKKNETQSGVDYIASLFKPTANKSMDVKSGQLTWKQFGYPSLPLPIP